MGVRGKVDDDFISRADKLKDFCGKKLRFRSRFHVNPSARGKHMLCHVIDTEDTELNVRIYYGNNKRVEDLLRNNVGAIFTATCSGYDLSHHDCSLLVDLTSIKLQKKAALVAVKKNKGREFFAFGYQSAELTHDEWLNITNVGCSICKTKPSEDDRDNLLWTDDSEFICPFCITKCGGK